MSDAVEPSGSPAPDDLPQVAGVSTLPGQHRSAPEPRSAQAPDPLLPLRQLEATDLDQRAGRIRQLMGEHGVSCFVHRNGEGSDEPWQLDLFPLILGAEEWRTLEAGLVQRARLLNAVLGDLYGTQRLVRDGFVPAPLVFANPGYLRACQALGVQGGHYLQVYAVDLGRSPGGEWWVLADRTQAPAGLGFAMENRSVLWRALPETMRTLQPRPLYSPALLRRETFRGLAPEPSGQGSIVLLTPGPRNEAYFEHAYLSRLLGLTLVEGDDLTVRNRCLFIKTLDGLRRADVVLRRVNDALCDPLELRSDSLLGVPGLVEASRAGQVGIGNALGAGLMESPAFMAFLPGLCRRLLAEELRLPSLATWWCGQGREQAIVRERFDELALRPAFNLAGAAADPEDLAREERAALLRQVNLRPHEFVGQELLPLSHAPVWSASRRHDTRPFVLRVFVLHDGRDFTVLPGGLARLLDQDRIGSCALPLSGPSQDVWVLPAPSSPPAPAEIVSLAAPVLEPAPSDLPSRTADNFFWLGRYTERVEQLARAARHALRCLDAEASGFGPRHRAGLSGVLARLRLLAPHQGTAIAGDTLETDLRGLLFDEERPGGARDLLRRIHAAAFSLRDRFSADTWRILNRLEPDTRQPPELTSVPDALSALHLLILDLAAFSGMEMENMTRGYGWAFLDLGRRLERGIAIASLTAAVLRNESNEAPLLETALEIADSVMTHRRRYFSEPSLASALDVLVRDATNPRSLTFQIESLQGHAAALPSGSNPEGLAVVRGRIGRLVARLANFSAATLGDPPPPIAELAGILASFTADLGALSELITQVYFSHVTPQVS